LAYGFGGKGVPGVELLVVSSGFVLRPLAGSAATGVRPSGWFLAVCCLAALALATGKRQVELVSLGPTAAAHRPTLRHYSVRGLKVLQALSIAGVLVTYGAWAESRVGAQDRVIAIVSLIPVLVAFARVSVLNNRGEGGAPELLVFRDRWIQAAVVCWVALFVGGIGRV
jgi:decaprenyl-phosphate phosphoribosyltransferase